MSQPAGAVLQEAARLLRSARHAVAFTGAGISTPSGIPDFRSQNTGLWQRYDPMEVASLKVFQAHPERFYDWLRPLLQTIWQAEPNPAHLALVKLEAGGILKAVITQNIDDLHQRAGSQNVLEVHGSLNTMHCSHCKESYASIQFRDLLSYSAALPRCAACSRVLKPDITLFGEMLPEPAWEAAETHCLQADVILVAGTSLEVWPAAALPKLAIEQGAQMIINNFTATPLDSQAAVLLPGDVREILPRLADLTLTSVA